MKKVHSSADNNPTHSSDDLSEHVLSHNSQRNDNNFRHSRRVRFDNPNEIYFDHPRYSENVRGSNDDHTYSCSTQNRYSGYNYSYSDGCYGDHDYRDHEYQPRYND